MAHSYASGVVGHNCHSPVGYFTASLPDILSRRYRFIASSIDAAACSAAAIETYGEGGKSRPLIAKSRDKWGHPEIYVGPLAYNSINSAPLIGRSTRCRPHALS